MLKAVFLQNFRSHKETEIEFDPGVNAFIGTSRNGKTNILRAILWVLNNKPSGASMVSKWVWNAKDKQTDDCAVQVLTEEHVITRRKTQDENCYELDGEVFEKVGLEVPEGIQKAFNMNDTNVQKQLDQAFLLSESAGETARYFNNIIHLDDIDKMLSAADSMKRQNKASLFQTELEINSAKEILSKLDWVDSAEKEVGKLARVQDRITAFSDDLENISSILSTWEAVSTELSKYKNIEQAIEKIEKLSNIQDKLDDVKDQWEDGEALLFTSANIEKQLSKIPDIKPAENIIFALLEQKKCCDEVENTILQITGLIQHYNLCQTTIESLEKELKASEKQMPECCPVCGGKL